MTERKPRAGYTRYHWAKSDRENPGRVHLLVDRATHPDTLNVITEEMGEDWKEYATNTEGGEIADRQHACGHIMRRDKSFFEDSLDVLFMSDEEQIRTHLDDDRIEHSLRPTSAQPA